MIFTLCCYVAKQLLLYQLSFIVVYIKIFNISSFALKYSNLLCLLHCNPVPTGFIPSVPCSSGFALVPPHNIASAGEVSEFVHNA